jgi:hypothetical protein
MHLKPQGYRFQAMSKSRNHALSSYTSADVRTTGFTEQPMGSTERLRRGKCVDRSLMSNETGSKPLIAWRESFEGLIRGSYHISLSLSVSFAVRLKLVIPSKLYRSFVRRKRITVQRMVAAWTSSEFTIEEATAAVYAHHSRDMSKSHCVVKQPTCACWGCHAMG